jgi:potassium-dependent mechanosensitive channel
MKNIVLITCCFLKTFILLAQDSASNGQPKQSLADTTHSVRIIRHTGGNINRADKKKVDYFKDTIRRERRKFDSSLFTNINVPSTSDYAEDLGKVYQNLSDIPGVTGSFVRLPDIQQNLDREDSVLDVIKDRMSQGERTFNVRNLQMVNTLLDALDRNTDNYTDYLNQYDSALDEVREEIADLRKDTLMRQIFRDTALKNAFQPQIQQLKTKWREVDSLVTINGQLINTLKSQASANSITIGELLSRVDMELKAVGSRAFHKEQPYLWEAPVYPANASGDDFNESVDNEKQLARFYFANTYNNRFWLILIGFLFYLWVNLNFRKLTRLNKMSVLEDLHITYLSRKPLAASLILALSLIPLFDFHAPAIYIELIQCLLMLVVTFILRKRVAPKLLYGWCTFILLFIIVPLFRIFGLSLYTQRWANLVVDTASVILAIYFLLHLRARIGKWIAFSIGLYAFLNLLAIICNLLSRVTLSQIFGYTAAYSFAQTISLGVFVELVVESFLLQVQTSRISKNYPPAFESSVISNSVRRFAIIVAIVLWLIVFTINLNLFDATTDLLVSLFTKTRQVGNFSFTIGGIFMFLAIIWLANFLQRYIAYFFGDTGDDAAFDDKGQRSRLMVTRLILLIVGFLLAVAASGLAVDRITVILGALGVGIGLGLQGIVNNFVSGIILIFDRPLRIGDTVDIGDKRGRVKEIGIRSSTLLTEEGAEVIIPNGDVLSHNIVNWTLSNNHARVALSFTVNKPANSGDIDEAAIRKLIHENQNVIAQRDPEIVLSPVNSKTMEMKLHFWISDFNKEAVTSGEVRTSVYQYLETKGIIPE